MTLRSLFLKITIIFPVFFLGGIIMAFSQNKGPAIEQWRSFLPYNQVHALSADYKNDIIYCATEYGFFYYNRQDGSLETFSKVNGMHDIGMTGVSFDQQTNSVLLGYKNGNIDIYKNKQFYNVPDLKISQISGNKTIYHATSSNGTGFLSTGIGLVVVNLTKNEISYTVSFYQGNLFATVYQTYISGNNIYAATNVGLFKTNLSNQFIQDYSSWEKISSQAFTNIVFTKDRLFAAQNRSIYVYESDSNVFKFLTNTPQDIVQLSKSALGFWASVHNNEAEDDGSIYLYNAQGQLLDSILSHSPTDVVELNNGEIWFSDNSDYSFRSYFGLRKRLSYKESESYTPDGPISANAFDISAFDGNFWVAHGGHNSNWAGARDRSMVSAFRDNEWKNFPWLSDNGWVQDFVRILYKANSHQTYAGSITGGLVEFGWDDVFEVHGEGKLPPAAGFGNEGLFNVSGLAFDEQGNLWISSNGCTRELSVKTADGQWYPMQAIPGNVFDGSQHSAANVIADDYGQLWMTTTNGNGVLVYDPNGTLDNNHDDRYRILNVGEGNGNLPDNKVNDIAKTRNGSIWIASNNGIGIIHCPYDVIEGQCETNLNPVQIDEFASDWLFVRQTITAIAVDGGDRKWIGSGNGVWLINTDGDEIETIYRFTTENSPLPSNNIQRISIDPVTGDVFFLTDKGFVAFRSTATTGKPNDYNPLLVYPNPVPSEYQGQIAVKGVPDRADVRFTDIAGKLVYRTTALGRQAVWNGKDYKGRKVQSGVYLVFITSKDGTEKMTTKIIIQN